MTIFYTVGEEIYSPSEYKRSLESSWRQAINGAGEISDHEATRLYSVSATAFACINFRANTLSQIPISVKNSRHRDLPGDWHPLDFFISNSPELLWHAEVAMNIWGAAYFKKVPNDHGFLTGLQWLHPEDVDPEYDYNTGKILFYRYQYSILQPEQLVHIPAWNPNRQASGKSPFEVAISPVATEANIIRFASSFFFNGARPDGMLIAKTVVDDATLDKARADWKAFKGATNAHKTFVSSGDWVWQPITNVPEGLAMVDLKAEVRRDICVTFEVNPALIGAGDVSDPLSANSTRESIKRSHIQDVTLPRLNYILDKLNTQWAWRDFTEKKLYTLVPDLKKVPALSNLTADRITSASQMLASPGLADYNEARELIGLEPRERFYLQTPPDPLLAMFDRGAMTINELREAQGWEPFFGANGDVVIISNTPVPVDKINEFASLLAEHGSMPSPQPPGFPAFQLARSLITKPEHPGKDETEVPANVSTTHFPVIPQLGAGTPLRSARTSGALSIYSPLPGAQVIKYAKRSIATELAQQDIVDIDWLEDIYWHVPIITSTGSISAADAGSIIRELSLDEAFRVSLRMKHAEIVDGTLIIRFHPSQFFRVLRASIFVSMADFGISEQDEDAYLVLGFTTLEDTLSLPPFIELDWPVTLNDYTLAYDGVEIHTWTARAASGAQVRELRNWKTKVDRKGPKAVFSPVTLQDTPVARALDWGLRSNLPSAALFDNAFKYLRGVDFSNPEEAATPDEYAQYWDRYDQISAELGTDWFGYMQYIWSKTEGRVSGGFSADQIEDILEQAEDALASEWVGTMDAPGPLLQLTLAGMAAGNQALINNIPADYRSIIRATVVESGWDEMSQEAFDFAQQYSYQLIRGLNATTRQQVQRAVSAWVESDQPLTELQRSLNAIFNNPERARVIAQTESARVYNKGAQQRWLDVGVKRAIWITVRDERVCPVCEPRDGSVGIIGEGWNGRDQPAHPRCRCFSRPDISSVGEEVKPGEGQTPLEQGYDETSIEIERPEVEEINVEELAAQIAATYRPSSLRGVSEYSVSRQPVVLPSVTGEDTILRQMFDENPEASSTPAVVTRGQLDALISGRGWTEVYRGVTSEDHAEQYRTGDVYGSRGAFGNGTYVAAVSGGRTVDDVIRSVTPYAGSGGAIIRMAVNPNARVISLNELRVLYRQRVLEIQYRAQGADPGLQRRAANEIQVISDLGRLALAEGYDAIKVDYTNEYIILNRTAVAVDSGNYLRGVDNAESPR
jgi:HK97 family phage portal protein